MTSLHHSLLGCRISGQIKQSGENSHLQWGTSFYTLRKKRQTNPKSWRVWFRWFSFSRRMIRFQLVYSPSCLSHFFGQKDSSMNSFFGWVRLSLPVRFQMPKFIRNHCIYQPQQGSIKRKFKNSIDLNIKFDSFQNSQHFARNPSLSRFPYHPW